MNREMDFSLCSGGPRGRWVCVGSGLRVLWGEAVTRSVSFTVATL